MEDNLKNALLELSKNASRSKANQLRALFPEIMNLKMQGIKHDQIIEALKKNGLEFNLKTFELTFYRIKREFENEKHKRIEKTGTTYVDSARAEKVIQEFKEESKTRSHKTGFHRILDELSAENSEKDPRRNEV
ncbi:hypothetical protein RGU75_02325 [Glaciimonas sp. CA11.2]|uniref:hypothetical protein n=1 Tax=Glaciimonas sp. CA11.2 TaxID=3048601 RepID=UPI002AB51959|nr:hypothetical protein [Glaciimonas sp. CA11.2]MDY7545069.1 hypothetical protein [Glaciimonas sp. CA11.2]